MILKVCGWSYVLPIERRQYMSYYRLQTNSSISRLGRMVFENIWWENYECLFPSHICPIDFVKSVAYFGRKKKGKKKNKNIHHFGKW